MTQSRPGPTSRTPRHLWVIGIVGGALLVGIAGVLAARSVVTQPPAATLRQAQ